jgi:AcrR family transcriptional regulator
MARPRDFDIDAATNVALAIFWRHGYAATSVRALCEAMSIQPGSFYAAFESKEACFRRALGRYLETQGLPREPGEAAIVAWMRAIVSPRRRGLGCLLVNSAVEAEGLDPANASFVRSRMKAMEAFFVACLEERPTAQADALLLSSVVIAVHVRQRAGASRGELAALVVRAFEAVGIDASNHR